jgi:hypothetical protein
MSSLNGKTRKAASTTYAANLLRSASLNNNSGGAGDVCVVGAGGTQGDWFLLIFLGEDARAQSPRRCRNRSSRAEL